MRPRNPKTLQGISSRMGKHDVCAASGCEAWGLAEALGNAAFKHWGSLLGGAVEETIQCSEVDGAS